MRNLYFLASESRGRLTRRQQLLFPRDSLNGIDCSESGLGAVWRSISRRPPAERVEYLDARPARFYFLTVHIDCQSVSRRALSANDLSARTCACAHRFAHYSAPDTALVHADVAAPVRVGKLCANARRSRLRVAPARRKRRVLVVFQRRRSRPRVVVFDLRRRHWARRRHLEDSPRRRARVLDERPHAGREWRWRWREEEGHARRRLGGRAAR